MSDELVLGSIVTYAMKRPSARPALRKHLKCGSEQPLLLAGRANPLQVQVWGRIARRRENEAVRVGRPDRRRLVRRAGGRFGRGAARSVEEPDSVAPGRIDRPPPVARRTRGRRSCMAPAVPTCPPRCRRVRNHVGWVMVRSPVQYTSVPLAETAKAALTPSLSTPSATPNRLPSQVETLQVEPLGHEGAVAHEKEEVRCAEAKRRRVQRRDRRLRSGESSDAT